MRRTWLASLLVFAALFIQAQCGPVPNGGGIVDNGAKPTTPADEDDQTEPPPPDDETPSVESFLRADLKILGSFLVEVRSGNWSVETRNDMTILSNRKNTITFTRIAPFTVEVTEETEHGVGIARPSPTQTVFVFSDELYVWAGHDARTPEIDAILNSLRERSP